VYSFLPLTMPIDPSQVVRVSEDAFQNLPDFSYKPRYSYYNGLRYAFIDEESPSVLHDGKTIPLTEVKPGTEIHWETFLCLHGEPTWSFLFRRMIPVFLNRPAPKGSEVGSLYVRRRVLAPDWIGFGRSDKPTDDDFYTWDMHHEFLCQFVQKHLVEENVGRASKVIPVVQDWGGLLGLTLPPLFPRLITHFLIMNTAFGSGRGAGKGFINWRDYVAKTPNLKMGEIIGRGTKHLTKEEIAAYNAPFPNNESKAGARRFPALVPITKGMAGVASSLASYAFLQSLAPGDMRIFICIGGSDPVLGPYVMEHGVLPAFESSTGALVMTNQEAGHFVQEWGAPIAEKAIDAWGYETDELASNHIKEVKVRRNENKLKSKL